MCRVQLPGHLMESLPAPEPNWLLTALVTASTTVISIIAGLLIARLVSDRTDSEQVARELDVARVAKRGAQNASIRALRAHTQERVHDFIRRSLRKMVDELAIVDVATLMGQAGSDGLTTQELLPAVEAAKARIVAVRTELLSRVDETLPWAKSWPNRWSAAERQYRVAVPPGEEYLYELLWESLWRARAEEERTEAKIALLRRHEEAGRRGEATSVPTSEQVDRDWDAIMADGPEAHTPPRRQDRLDALADAAAVADEEADLASSRVDLLKSQSLPKARPGVVVAALWILGVLTVLGVVLPLGLLAGTPVELSGGWRWPLSAAFAICIGALTVTLMVASGAGARTSRNGPATDSSPA